MNPDAHNSPLVSLSTDDNWGEVSIQTKETDICSFLYCSSLCEYAFKAKLCITFVETTLSFVYQAISSF